MLRLGASNFDLSFRDISVVGPRSGETLSD